MFFFFFDISPSYPNLGFILPHPSSVHPLPSKATAKATDISQISNTNHLTQWFQDSAFTVNTI